MAEVTEVAEVTSITVAVEEVDIRVEVIVAHTATIARFIELHTTDL